MSLIIRGPHPANNNMVVLPSPQETNTQGLRSTVQTVRMMNSSLRTFIKPKNSRNVYRWEFIVGVGKANEVEDYVLSHSGQPCSVVYKDQTYIGYLTLNPLEMEGRADEFFRLVLEFEDKT